MSPTFIFVVFNTSILTLFKDDDSTIYYIDFAYTRK
jgi:hypothetical protein